MLNMKKDMGGAATVMAVAAMVMACKLPVRLRLLVPAVENSVSGNAFRPLDVVPTRKGISVEIGNTDAEGRLILCDALHEGATEKPTMMVDCATLTGAARVSLGTDLPALFCNNDELADGLLASGTEVSDPMWRMPLCGPIAGCSTARWPTSTTSRAALRRRHHRGALPAGVRADDVPWAHFDMMAWNNCSRPGRPEGGEAQAARAIFATIESRIGEKRVKP
jgi:leucyl aminopeptidase